MLLSRTRLRLCHTLQSVMGMLPKDIIGGRTRVLKDKKPIDMGTEAAKVTRQSSNGKTILKTIAEFNTKTHYEQGNETWHHFALGIARLSAFNFFKTNDELQQCQRIYEKIHQDPFCNPLIKLLIYAATSTPDLAVETLNNLDNKPQKFFDDLEADHLSRYFTVMGQLGVRNDGVLRKISRTVETNLRSDPLNYDNPVEKNMVLTPENLADISWGVSIISEKDHKTVQDLMMTLGDGLTTLRTEGEREGYYKSPKKHSGISKWDHVMFRVQTKPYLALLPVSKIVSTMWAFSIAGAKHDLLLKYCVEELCNKFLLMTTDDLTATAFAAAKFEIYSPEFMYLHAARCTEVFDKLSRFQILHLVTSYHKIKKIDAVGFSPDAFTRKCESLYLGTGKNNTVAQSYIDEGIQSILSNEVYAGEQHAVVKASQAVSKNSVKKAAKLRRNVKTRALKIVQMMPESAEPAAGDDPAFFAEESLVRNDVFFTPYTQPRASYAMLYKSKWKEIQHLFPHGDPLSTLSRTGASRAYLPSGGLKWGTVDI